MTYLDELDAMRMVASRGDNFRPATRRGIRKKNGQAETVAWKLGALIEGAALSEMGTEFGEGLVREVRLVFLNWLFRNVEYPTIRYGMPFRSARDLTFAEASAVLNWAFTGRAWDDVALWLRDSADELGLSYTERMF